MAPTSISSSSSNHLPEITGRIPISSTDHRSAPPSSTITRNGSKQGSELSTDQDQVESIESTIQPSTSLDSPLESLETLSNALPTCGVNPHQFNSPHVQQTARVGVNQPLLLPLQNSALGLMDYGDTPLYNQEGRAGSLEMNGYENELNDAEEDFELKRRTGVTKFFNVSKGFGFILDHEAEELDHAEVFVHYTAIRSVQGGPRSFKSLLEGEEVAYSIVQGPKGWQAQDVTGPTGGPCIGSPSPTPLPRTSFSGPPTMNRKSSSNDFRSDYTNGHGHGHGRRSSGMVSESTHSGSRGGRVDSGFYSSGIASPRDIYSNMSSPPSQTSAQLSGTPNGQYFYTLSPTSPMMFTNGVQPIYGSPQIHPNGLAYYPVPPPGVTSYYPSPASGLSMALPPQGYPPFPPVLDQNLLPQNPYPISNFGPSPQSAPLSIDTSPAPNPYSDLYSPHPTGFYPGSAPTSSSIYPISSSSGGHFHSAPPLSPRGAPAWTESAVQA